MDNKPIIGISCSVINDLDSLHNGPEKIFLNSSYYQAIQQAGGLPIVLPLYDNDTDVFQIVNNIDGLLLSGGGDVSPLLFAEQPHQSLGEVCPERDWLEIALVKEAVRQNKPVLGICRGQQLLNVALGGDLYQDLSQNAAYYVQHRQRAKGYVASHNVKIAEGSVLHGLIGETYFAVNSFHHQAVKNIAKGLWATAWSDDGLIEAIEAENGLLIAVQWHPERMCQQQRASARLFTWLIEKVRGE